MTDEQRLAEANDALHQLMMGKSAVEIGHSTRKVVFSQRSITDLKKYIGELEVLCGRSHRRGPGRIGL